MNKMVLSWVFILAMGGVLLSTAQPSTYTFQYHREDSATNIFHKITWSCTVDNTGRADRDWNIGCRARWWASAFFSPGALQWFKNNPGVDQLITSVKFRGACICCTTPGPISWTTILFDNTTNNEYSFGQEGSVWVDWNYSFNQTLLTTYAWPDSAKGSWTVPGTWLGQWFEFDVTKLMTYCAAHTDVPWAMVWIPDQLGDANGGQINFMAYEETVDGDSNVQLVINTSAPVVTTNEKGGLVDQRTVWVSNNPNPFNGSTSILFTLPGGQHQVKACVYDLQGRLVRELTSSQYQGGIHNLAWNGLNQKGQPAVNGVYLLSMNVDGKAYQQKMIKN